MMILEKRVVTPTEALHAVTSVDNLRSHWHEVRSNAFFTIGRPLYQLASEMALYQFTNSPLNKLLWGELEDLYLKTFDVLEDHLGAPVYHLPSTAIPGFHVFVYQKDAPSKGGAPHFDLSHFAIANHLGLAIEAREHLSYALPLELPGSETGIDFYPGLYDPARKGNDQEVAGKAVPSFTPYRVGLLYLFSGYRLHRISVNEQSAAEGRRLTLQGHLFRIANHWITYW
jgi:hypothetical protein